MGSHAIILCNDCREHDPNGFLTSFKITLDQIKEIHKEFLEKHKTHDVRIMSDANGQYSVRYWDYDNKDWSDEFWDGL